jgi:hypothetical protein
LIIDYFPKFQAFAYYLDDFGHSHCVGVVSPKKQTLKDDLGRGSHIGGNPRKLWGEMSK